jgi:hypothetical protein
MDKKKSSTDGRKDVDPANDVMFHKRIVSSTMSMESFEQFRQIVLKDTALQERLRMNADHRSFVNLVVRAGEERGCHFTPADVEAAMSANRRAWLQHRMM